jgi:hypothetical protein
MTPKEKASELVNKYYYHSKCNLLSPFEAKNCALIAVEEILQSGPTKIVWEDDNTEIPIMDEEWWESVKQEIENL